MRPPAPSVRGPQPWSPIRYKGKEKVKIGIRELDTAPFDEEKQHIAERIQLDIYYIENWSLLLDIEILFRTFIAFKNAF